MTIDPLKPHHDCKQFIYASEQQQRTCCDNLKASAQMSVFPSCHQKMMSSEAFTVY